MTTQTTLHRLTATTVAAGALLVLTSATPALAWHPKGVITKDVQNLTTHSASQPADTTATAVTAHPGDELVYTITIKNQSPTAKNTDDMGFTKLTDALPAGLTLVSGQPNQNIGTVKAQGSFQTKVTVRVNQSVTNGAIIKNTACFSGAATNNEAGTQQKGCDDAIVKITVLPTPTPTPTPVASVTPTPTPTPTGQVLSTQTTLPKTGGATALSTALGLTTMTGAFLAYHKSRHNKQK